ncbi:hypothetical protein LZ24_01212 [Desulfobotulus alkaliphilus]|uniref:Uncharacterized protein n=1 Tax=Desulfobotulus alkaliphilus TaxID=622671 RepID=A0A562RY78_9BACT|nr:hypothetical protein LZ24_01212 [Desulfobotulus alkaliphilus]
MEEQPAKVFNEWGMLIFTPLLISGFFMGTWWWMACLLACGRFVGGSKSALSMIRRVISRKDRQSQFWYACC